MEYFQRSVQNFFTESNNKYFVLGLIAVLLIFYIYRGDGHKEKIHRIFIIIFTMLVCVVTYFLLSVFSK